MVVRHAHDVAVVVERESFLEFLAVVIKIHLQSYITRRWYCRLQHLKMRSLSHHEWLFHVPTKCRFVVRFMLHSQEVHKAVHEACEGKGKEDIRQSVGPILSTPASSLALKTRERSRYQCSLVPPQRHISETS